MQRTRKGTATFAALRHPRYQTMSTLDQIFVSPANRAVNEPALQCIVLRPNLNAQRLQVPRSGARCQLQSQNTLKPAQRRCLSVLKLVIADAGFLRIPFSLHCNGQFSSQGP